jgi:hypothetical protein
MGTIQVWIPDSLYARFAEKAKEAGPVKISIWLVDLGRREIGEPTVGHLPRRSR